MSVAIIIPALDEEGALPQVLRDIPPSLAATVVVVDNGSSDRTAEVARQGGAVVLREEQRGYGAACQAGVAALPDDIEIVVFMDADGSDAPEEAAALIEPLRLGEADLALGSRELGRAEAGALNVHQRLGNRLAVGLMRLFFGRRFTDLGPFRAIRADRLAELGMRDPNYGWTIEMQIKAVRQGLRIVELPVSCRRRRGGSSKVSGNPWGSVAAGAKILWTVAKFAWT